MKRFKALVGLGGVYGTESNKARFIGKIFERCLAIIALALLFQWHFENFEGLHPYYNLLINCLIWLFFVVEMSILLKLVRNRQRHLRLNWFKIVVIIIGIPLIVDVVSEQGFYQLVRPVFAVILFIPWMGIVKRSLTDNRLLTTLITIFFTVIVAGFLMSGMDPGIKTPIQGIWWAWVTMSTVGYGDYAPVTITGQVFASIIILIGLCFFAILTANFSRMFIRHDVSRAKSQEIKDIKRVIEYIDHVDVRDQKILEKLESIDKRLQALEK